MVTIWKARMQWCRIEILFLKLSTRAVATGPVVQWMRFGIRRRKDQFLSLVTRPDIVVTIQIWIYTCGSQTRVWLRMVDKKKILICHRTRHHWQWFTVFIVIFLLEFPRAIANQVPSVRLFVEFKTKKRPALTLCHQAIYCHTYLSIVCICISTMRRSRQLIYWKQRRK